MAYAVPVELGTGPHMPPIRPLADWAEHKLGVAPEKARSVGYRIARKIAAKGTDGAHMFERAFTSNEAQVRTIFAQCPNSDRMAGGAATGWREDIAA